MEGIDSNWDDLLKDTLQFSTDTLNHPESVGHIHGFDLEFGSGLWTGPMVVYPTTAFSNL
jgi:hypothetical protein